MALPFFRNTRFTDTFIRENALDEKSFKEWVFVTLRDLMDVLDGIYVTLNPGETIPDS
jgi:hypothetical protein